MKYRHNLFYTAAFLIVLMASLPLASAYTLTYDANGNLITGDGKFRIYNGFNKLVQIREGDNATAPILENYTWHPLEDRIFAKSVYQNGSWQETVYYITKSFVRVENASGNYDYKYVYQNGQLVAQQNPDGSKLFFHNDHLGSVGLVTNESGAKVEETFYEPFGKIISGGATSRFDYEAKEFDSIVGDYDFHARKYNPDWGVLTSADSIIQNVYDPQTLNRYTFEHNSPYKYEDKDGHLAWIPVIIGVSAVIGGVFNVVNYAQTHDTWDSWDAAKYFAAGAVSGGALAAGALLTPVVGVTTAIATTFAGGAIGKIIEDQADEVSLGEDSLGIAGAGILNAAGMGLSELIPTKQLHKNIASMNSLTSMLTTKSGQNYLGASIASESISNLFTQYGGKLFNNPSSITSSSFGSLSVSNMGDSLGKGQGTSISVKDGAIIINGKYSNGKSFTRVITSKPSKSKN